MRPRHVLNAFAASSLAASLLPIAAGAQPPDKQELPTPPADMPAAFQQLLPRGAIASVDTPQFVKAADAEITDDAWILGVVVNGEARAYSLNLLNRHEVVNDHVGGRSIAAVW